MEKFLLDGLDVNPSTPSSPHLFRLGCPKQCALSSVLKGDKTMKIGPCSEAPYLTCKKGFCARDVAAKPKRQMHVCVWNDSDIRSMPTEHFISIYAKTEADADQIVNVHVAATDMSALPKHVRGQNALSIAHDNIREICGKTVYFRTCSHVFPLLSFRSLVSFWEAFPNEN